MADVTNAMNGTKVDGNEMSESGKVNGKEDGVDKRHENEKRLSKKDFNREINNAVKLAMQDMNTNISQMIETAINKVREEHRIELAIMKAEFQGQVTLLKKIVTE